MATAIEVGYAAISRDAGADVRTTICGAAADGTGKITSVEIWARTEMAGCEVAIFTQGEANVFSTRDYETVNNGNGAGVVLAGSKQTFVVDLDVVEGDFIGIYYSAGTIEFGTGGSRWYSGATVDWIPCTDETFTSQGFLVSLYGTGATVVGTSIMFTFSDF